VSQHAGKTGGYPPGACQARSVSDALAGC
jgi:hypothetical protein